MSTLEARFWKWVDKKGPDECWPWKGKLNEAGYGRLPIPRRDPGRVVSNSEGKQWVREIRAALNRQAS